MRTALLVGVGLLCGLTGCSEVISTGDCSSDPYRVEPHPPLTRDAALDEWAGPVRADGTRERCAAVYEGSCADGKRFLFWDTDGAVDAVYFGENGDVVGGVHRYDFVIDGCTGSFFGDIHCQNGVGAPLCGDAPAGEASWRLRSFSISSGESSARSDRSRMIVLVSSTANGRVTRRAP
jgi:hypothetical protein